MELARHDIDRLQHSNERPLPLEENIIRDLLSLQNDRFLSLTAEIEAKERDGHIVNANLTLMRDMAESRISVYKSILSPVRRLPFEVLSEIFVQATADQEVKQSLDTKSEPWTFTHVSQRWRDVAVEEAKLWTAFHVDGMHLTENLSRHHEELMATFFSRAKGLPVSITFKDTNDLKVNPAQILDKLIALGSHWKDADLTFNAHPELVLHLEQLAGKLSILEWLRLCVDQSDISVEEPLAMIACATAPELHTVYLECHRSIDIRLPLAQLRTYSERGTEDLLVPSRQLLPHLTSVVTLDLTSASYHEHIEDLSEDSQYVFPCLRNLVVAATDVLRFLTAPRLENVEIRSKERARLNDVHSLCTRSSCSLKSLAVNTHEISPSLCQLLRHTPTLTYLKICTSVYDWDIIRIFNPRIGGPPVLPALETLKIICEEDAAFNEGILERMLTARCMKYRDAFSQTNPVVRMTTFLLNIPSDNPWDNVLDLPKVDPIISVLRAEGLRINVDCGPLWGSDDWNHPILLDA